MKRMIPLMAMVVGLTVLAPSAHGSAATWKIDPEHSSIGFSVRHMMISNIRGEFRKFEGTAELDEADITKSRIQVTVDTASLNTGVEARDDHLRTDEFLDVAKYPSSSFESTGIVKKRGGKLKLIGNLTLHGVTRQVVFDVTGPTGVIKDPKGSYRRGATATAQINRKDFGITWHGVLDNGGALIGDKVLVMVELELVRT